MSDETEQRDRARLKFEAGEFRAALHLWDSLEHPELLNELEVSMREVALRERDR
jgi:hypothetical protein